MILRVWPPFPFFMKIMQNVRPVFEKKIKVKCICQIQICNQSDSVIFLDTSLPLWLTPIHNSCYASYPEILDIYIYIPVLDRRPKFYGDRCFRTFPRPKVVFVVFLFLFSKLEPEMCFSLHRCYFRLN